MFKNENEIWEAVKQLKGGLPSVVKNKKTHHKDTEDTKKARRI